MMIAASGNGECHVRHHPSETTLAAYANGSLGRLHGLVVATHLGFCPTCRATAHLAETVGGLLLEQLPPAPIAHDALERTLARLDGSFDETRCAEELSALTGPASSALLPALLGLRKRRFRWLAPGIYFAELLRSGDELLGLLRLRAGVVIPLHGHRGAELSCVLEGAYREDTSLYGPGDLEEANTDVQHRPVAEGPGNCLCLVATRGTRTLFHCAEPFVAAIPAILSAADIHRGTYAKAEYIRNGDRRRTAETAR